MSEQTLGQRWIQFLRGYTPTTQNDNMITEKTTNLVARYQIDPIRFEHPLEVSLIPLFFANDGSRKPRNALKNVILTGMAGDGKTSLCYTLWNKLFDSEAPRGKWARQDVSWDGDSLSISFIFDFSAFFTPQEDQLLPPEVLTFLEHFSESIFSEEAPGTIFIVAINDGQFAELWRRLPESSPANRLAGLITDLHATNRRDSEHRLSFYNLSLISTRELFARVYEAFVSRFEWDDCLAHPELKEFGPYSPLIRNLDALRSPQYKNRLHDLVSLCDGCKRHIPIRELLMWMANGLIGLKKAPQGVARLNELRGCLTAEDAYRGALRRNLLGENLTQNQRDRFAIFRFLQGLKLGNETITDLDELIIFGEHLGKLKDAYEALVKPDLFQQRDPSLEHKLRSYIQGGTEDYTEVLDALSSERRRIFFSSDAEALKDALPNRSIWAITVFHSAEDYLIHLLDGGVPDPVPNELIQKLILGLNRVWTGLLAEDTERLFVAKGLNLSSAAISDIFVVGVPITDDFGESLISIVRPGPTSWVPQLRIVWRIGHDPFMFDLTLERFEFLVRVADGVMPNAFSKECWEDIITLKTKFLRHMQRAGFRLTGIRTIETDSSGKLRSVAIV
ncbi:MAG: hypothetical protein HY881_18520 [Deltaproteobacteria bacterium]|nr:hypothetical protein [Deltaproteobacteria bacterium]